LIGEIGRTTDTPLTQPDSSAPTPNHIVEKKDKMSCREAKNKPFEPQTVLPSEQ